MLLRGNAVVGQSGGPTAAINATLAGVIMGALDAGDGAIDKIYGMRNGIEGLLEEKLIDLGSIFSEKSMFDDLALTPAAALGSCRRKLPSDYSDAIYSRIFSVFSEYNIRYFFYIGGNDSMDTALKLSGYADKIGYDIRIIGVPKTIDNDLEGTDHTPGYGSAAKYVAITVKELLRDCSVYTLKAVTIVEIMGRDAGWLTCASALPKLSGGDMPDLIYLPERPFDMEEFLNSVANAFERHPNILVAVSEGIRFKDGRYVGESAQSGNVDVFGHRYLAGTGKVLESAVKERFGCKARSVELSLTQRCAAHVASYTDISESVETGRRAVGFALEGKSGCMVSVEREQDRSLYSIRYNAKNVGEIANKVKRVPDEFINESGNGVTDACIEYMRPLIIGEVSPLYENGLPRHIVIG